MSKASLHWKRQGEYLDFLLEPPVQPSASAGAAASQLHVIYSHFPGTQQLEQPSELQVAAKSPGLCIARGWS